jgi:membrane protein DedA with SNARE-associated domain
MTIVDISDFLLAALSTHGALALGLALLVAAMGLPTPAAPLIVAAGALARQGIVDWPTAMMLGLLGVILGDSISYALGRYSGDWVQHRLGQKSARLLQRAQARFRKNGAAAILLTRTLLTSLDVPTNFVAGGSHYPFRSFLTFVVTGRLAWLLLYGGIGYFFGSQWPAISRLIGEYSIWIAVIAAMGFGIWFILRQDRWHLASISASRKAARISPFPESDQD